ncbi:Flagellar biosynthetic protein FlhB [Thalassocella blandensis]|nr:Flagellar biosynthetic protein FlhB [Thalassocella blandensis]
MAEDDSSQEKTEEPTPRRLEKAREDGQIPRSRELTTTAVVLAGCLGLLFFGAFIAQRLISVMRFNFDLNRESIFDTSLMFKHLGNSFGDALFSLLPLFSILLVAAIAGPIALGGWLFSAKSLAPKLDRINPLSGLKRMFSVKSLVELVKAIGKIVLIIAVAYVLLSFTQDAWLGLAAESVESAIVHSVQLSITTAVVLAASTIIIAAIDIPFQIHEHTKKLKMSRQDIKDEMKDTEGKPEVKGRIRQLQQEMAQKRMMANVPQADVVITNPTHFSIALKYDPATMSTPILLAKGVDNMAMKIREIARLNNIEFVEAPLLARAIYHTTEVDDEVPQGLYVAVAQVLAYVFQLREYRKGRGQRPDYPRNLEIPPDMKKY